MRGRAKRPAWFLISHPTRPDVLWATAGYGRNDTSEPVEERIAGVYRSEDGGWTWQWLWERGRPRYVVPICVDPRPPHALTVAAAPTPFASHDDEGGAQAMLYRGDDGGTTWRWLGDHDRLPSAANLLAVCPDPEQTGGVLAGTDQGEVWQVSATGEWRQLVAGLPAILALGT